MPSARASSGESIVTSRPSKRISPASGGWTPASALTSVDLPAPLSPTSATTSPGNTVKFAPRSARTRPKLLTMRRASSRGSAMSAPSRRDGDGGERVGALEQARGDAGEQRRAAGAGLGDRRRLDVAEARLGGVERLVARPAPGDDDPATRSGDRVDPGELRLHAARGGVERGAPDALGGHAARQLRGAALQRDEVELERGRVSGSGGERARVELGAAGIAGAELVKDLLQRKAGPLAAEQRLAAFRDVPADADLAVHR